MKLTDAKLIADRPKCFPLEQLREARDRLARTRRNGGVRNSERAGEKLERRIKRLDDAIFAAGNDLASQAGLGP